MWVGVSALWDNLEQSSQESDLFVTPQKLHVIRLSDKF